ncbi:MAG TPA: ABC transporter permease [Acidimicrobiales bacterium]|nr:ABC transporter permease [Acidimicrobiales bacterium]
MSTTDEASAERHSAAAAQATVLIKGGKRGPSFSSLREVVAYRGVFAALVRRGITTRFRQSMGGILWLLAGPLSAALTYTVFVGGYAGVKGDKGTSYGVFVLVGTVTWSIFLRGGLGGMTSLVQNAAFVKKVYFPRVLLPLSFVGQSIADLVPAMVMMFGVSAALGEGARWSWFLIVVPFGTVLLFSAAFAIVSSAINVYVRDLTYASALLTQFGMFASAVVYPLDKIPEDYRTAYAIFNPIAGAVDSARAVVYRGDGLDLVITLGGLAWTLVVLLISFLIFSMLERNAADQI